MRSPSIDLTLLALLILFFGLQQRKRPESFFRVWLAGWILVLGSVALWESEAHLSILKLTFECLRLDCLVIGVVCFCLSFISMRRHDERLLYSGSFISGCACIALNMAVVGVGHPLLMSLSTICGNIAAILTVQWLIPASERHLQWCLIILCGSMGIVMSVAAFAGGASLLPSLLFAEVFVCAAMLLATLSGKDALGRLLGTTGFLAWGISYILVVLPSSAGLLAFTREAWYIPKHLVGFGMILILFRTSRDEADELGAKYRSLYEEATLLFEKHPNPMWIYRPHTGQFLSVNEAAVSQYGYSRDEFLKMTIVDIRPDEDRTRVFEAMEHPENLQRRTWTHKRKNGSVFDADITAHEVAFEGEPARFVLAIDISEREELNRQLQYKAHHDALTGLPNRTVIEDQIPQVLAQSTRDERKAAVITIDVDRFKQINDTLGHLAGDECLQVIAKRLSSRIRQRDVIARTGGEEFTAVIGGLSDAQNATKITDSILDLFMTPLQLSDQEVRVSVSIGVAIYPDDGDCMQMLRKRSDQALYCAKRQGGNQAVFACKEVYAPLERSRTVESSLRHAIRNGLFHLVYQPIFTKDRTLSYFEALLRSEDPVLASVGPGVFIPIAEERGLVLQIGDWVLREACRQLNEWKLSGRELRPVAINASAKQLARAGFCDEVQAALSQFDIEPHLLRMEVTETVVMENQDAVTDVMLKLSALGVQFAIDDFGTGYSSLARLADLPLASLKIDRSFVSRLGTESGRTIILGVARIAKDLRLKMVAEGVETEAQFRSLTGCACDEFQGYLLSKPLPAQQAGQLLHSPPKRLGEALYAYEDRHEGLPTDLPDVVSMV